MHREQYTRDPRCGKNVVKSSGPMVEGGNECCEEDSH